MHNGRPGFFQDGVGSVTSVSVSTAFGCRSAIVGEASRLFWACEMFAMPLDRCSSSGEAPECTEYTERWVCRWATSNGGSWFFRCVLGSRRQTCGIVCLVVRVMFSWFFFFWNTAIEYVTDRAQCGVKIVEGISSYECGNEFGAPSK